MKFTSRFFSTTSLALALTSFACACNSTPADGAGGGGSGGSGGDIPRAGASGDTGGGGAAAEVDASDAPSFECQIPDVDTPPDFVQIIGCEADFLALGSEPLDSSIPGARAVKTVFDRDFGPTDDLAAAPALYFQNSKKYQIHHEFASEHLSAGQGFSVVGSLAEFNTTEYKSDLRRFVLGSLTYYEGPDIWTYELSPYDTATAEMIEDSFNAIKASFFFGDRLRFHSASLEGDEVAAELPESISLVTTAEIFDGVDYQPLNVAEGYGRLRFITAESLETEYVSFRDITVLDRVPNDISTTAGIITQEFQTPLAHINVLSQNRGTPNMGLRGAWEDEELRALEGAWVRLKVGALNYEIEEVTQAEADAWWEDHKPNPVVIPDARLDVTELTDIADTVDISDYVVNDDDEDDDPSTGTTVNDGPAVLEAIREGIKAFGGKASNFGGLAHIEGLPLRKAFAVPLYYYFQFMEENGFDVRLDALLEDEDFLGDPAVRDLELEALRDDMKVAPVNQDFLDLLIAKLDDDGYSGAPVRFRSSTNAEDLDGFTGAGLYTSKSGLVDPDDEVVAVGEDPGQPVADAIRDVWASVWFFRAFEERSFRSIPHRGVGMALLVHRSFPTEEANGVALTNNPFDKSQLDPAFYVNVQRFGESVVLPEPGTTTDSFLYYYDQEGQDITYLGSSNLVAEGTHVLSVNQIRELGDALGQIHTFFSPIYAAANGGWWAMDVEFKFDGDDNLPADEAPLFIKQARPFGNR